jgi:hypothetical protein
MKMMIRNTSNPGLTVRSNVHFSRGGQGRMKLHAGPLPLSPTAPTGRIPRIARLMALALRFEDLLRRGEVADYAELARLGHVTRARVTQAMNLLMLAPDLQEAILFLPPVEEGRDPVKEWQVRPIAAEPLWSEQRRMWRQTGAPPAPRPA